MISFNNARISGFFDDLLYASNIEVVDRFWFPSWNASYFLQREDFLDTSVCDSIVIVDLQVTYHISSRRAISPSLPLKHQS